MLMPAPGPADGKEEKPSQRREMQMTGAEISAENPGLTEWSWCSPEFNPFWIVSGLHGVAALSSGLDLGPSRSAGAGRRGKNQGSRQQQKAHICVGKEMNSTAKERGLHTASSVGAHILALIPVRTLSLASDNFLRFLTSNVPTLPSDHWFIFLPRAQLESI
ncbi:hypothetical protein CB1_001546006 [Camelus ferus]|nr:hypothetical protein CB1_001546006 [Camelus ferus]